MSSPVTQWILQLTDKVTGPLRHIAGAAGKTQQAVLGVGGAIERIGKQAMALNHIGQSMQSMGTTIQGALAPMVQLDTAMHEVQMITGLSGQALKDLEGRAIDLSKTFGGPASGQAAVFTGILSDLGPQVADNQEALASMTDTVNKLGLTMKGDTQGAMRAMTTAVNVFGDSSWSAAQQADYMKRAANAMAAGTKEGNVNVLELAATLEKSAGAAKSAGLDIEELVAVSQTLGKLNIKGSDGGVAVRNVLTKTLSEKLIPKEALEALVAAGVNMRKLQDSTLPLAERLKELGKVQNDTGTLAQVFGLENVNAAQQLLKNIPLYEQYNNAIRNTNELERQAGVMQDSAAQRMARAQANIQALQLSLVGLTGEWGAHLAVFAQVLPTIGMALPALNALRVGLSFVAVKGLWPVLRAGALWLKQLLLLMLRAGQLAGATLTRLVASLFAGARAMAVSTSATGAATVATQGLRAAFMALNLTNPFGWITIGIGLLVTFSDEIGNAIDGLLEMIGLQSTASQLQAAAAAKAFAQGAEEGHMDTKRKPWLAAMQEWDSQQAMQRTLASLGLGGPTGLGADTASHLKDNIAGVASHSGVRNITVNIHDGLVHTLNVVSNNLVEGTAKVRTEIERTLMTALRDTEVNMASN
jgi:TP901 family phage tail tape measure protein